MSSAPPAEQGWLFEVYLTHRQELGLTATLTTYNVRVARATSRQPASELANALLAEVLAQRTRGQSDLFNSAASPASDWHLRFAHSGAVDEFTLGVQAVYLDPNAEVVSLLAVHFPEDPV